VSNERSILEILMIIISIVAIVLFIFNAENFLLTNSTLSEEDFQDNNLETITFPNLLIGTQSGDIHIRGQNSELKHIGSVKNDVQDIINDKNYVYVATTKDNSRAEERSQSSGKLLKFNKSKSDKSILNNVFSGPDKKVEIGGQVLDIEKTADKLLLATHDHQSTEKQNGKTVFDGQVIIMNKKNLDIKDKINLGSASDIILQNETVLTYGVGSKAILLRKNTLSKEDEIELEGNISDADIRDDKIYFTTLRNRKMAGVPNPPNVSHGYISIHNRDGNELAKIDLGSSSYPREVKAYNKKSLIINDYARKKIKFVDFEEEKVTEEIKLDDRPENLIISENRAYIIGAENNNLYVIDLIEKKIENKISVAGVNSISHY